MQSRLACCSVPQRDNIIFAFAFAIREIGVANYEFGKFSLENLPAMLIFSAQACRFK